MRNREEAAAHSKLSQLLSVATKSTLLPNIEIVDNVIVIPPDGGWGWMIVTMAFICYFIIDGVMYTFGIFLDEISESFGVHPTAVALAPSLMSGFYYVVGPFTCAVTNRHGFRIVGILGGLVSASAFLVSTFFLNLNMFLILMGVLCGIGFNMIYIPCLLIIGFYFEKWRALATAISLCGSSLGVIVFPPMVTTVMKNLHWTWKFRILGGLTVLTSICAFTFRPIRPVILGEGSRKHTLNIGFDESLYSFNFDRDYKLNGRKSIFSTYYNATFPTTSEYHDVTSIVSSTRRITSDPNDTTSDQSIAKSSYIYRTDVHSISLSTVHETENEPAKSSFKDCCRKIFCCCSSNTYKRRRASTLIENINRPLYRDDIFYTGSIFVLPQYSKATIAAPSAKKSSISYGLSVTRITTQRDIEQTGQCLLCPEAVLRTLATMLHFKLFKSPTFVMLVFSGFFSSTGIYCPYIFLVQRATAMNIDEDWAKLLLTVIGAANTLGRIMCGVLSWFPKINLLAVNYVTLIISGASIVVSNYLDTLAGQIAFVAVFGFNTASIAVLRSIVVVDLLGLENLTNAFGITTMFFGIGSFIGIPVAAVLHTYTGRYDESFIFAGCSMILSGLLFIPLGRLSKWEADRKRKVSFMV